MKQVKNYQIYALIAGKYAFVGKTNSKELKPIYWRHLRGENRYTRNCFTKGTPMELRMYVLTQVRADSSLAYRYEVAFIRILLDEGFHVLNSRGMIEDARDIHMITEKILEDLKRVPLQQRLEMGDIHQRAIMENTDKPNQVLKKEKIAERELANVKITIRGTATEKQRFVDYASKLGVTQRQALQLLL